MFSGVKRAWSIDDLRRLSRARLPRAVFDLFDGGAEDEITLNDNRAAWTRVRLLPRVLIDVAKVDTSAQVLGQRAKLPIIVAPTGAVGFGRHGADIAIARAAAAYDIPYTLSTSATASIEKIAAQSMGRHWFQAYILKERDFTMKLLDRAHAAGYEAAMITVDLAVGGKRERDFRNDFSLPFRYTARNVLDFATRPAWAWGMLRHGMPVMENLIGFTPGVTTAKGIVSNAGRNYDPSFDWDALARVRERWPGKLVIKGIIHPADAARAAALGCDAIVVSNHGGRQLDGTVSTADALPAVVREIGGRASVMVDGGLRRGVDVLKALAMGADAVLIGRATLYGAMAAGEAGALRSLEILANEFERSMQLCGVRSVDDIGPQLLSTRMKTSEIQ